MGGVQFEVHRALVGGRHCRDEREERAVQVAFAVALEGVHDIGGGERRAVGEDGVLAQGHLVFQVVYLNGRVGCQAALGPIGMHVQLVEPLEDVPAGREKDAGARADGVRIAPLVGHGGRERSGHAALRGHGLGGRVVVGRICRCGPGSMGCSTEQPASVNAPPAASAAVPATKARRVRGKFSIVKAPSLFSAAYYIESWSSSKKAHDKDAGAPPTDGDKPSAARPCVDGALARAGC